MNEPKPILRYKWEYSNFLEYIQDKKIERALIYAKTLGIDRRTLSNWASQPELREGLALAVDSIIEGMQRAGKNDWRMYKELYTMLGLDDIKNVDVTSNGETLPTVILESVYGTKPNFRVDNETAEADNVATNSNPE